MRYAFTISPRVANHSLRPEGFVTALWACGSLRDTVVLGISTVPELGSEQQGSRPRIDLRSPPHVGYGSLHSKEERSASLLSHATELEQYDGTQDRLASCGGMCSARDAAYII